MRYAKFTKPLSIALQEEIYEKIKTISEERKISMAEWIREILANTLIKNQQLI
jgi:predicted DNA-binding protein